MNEPHLAAGHTFALPSLSVKEEKAGRFATLHGQHEEGGAPKRPWSAACPFQHIPARFLLFPWLTSTG